MSAASVGIARSVTKPPNEAANAGCLSAHDRKAARYASAVRTLGLLFSGVVIVASLVACTAVGPVPSPSPPPTTSKPTDAAPAPRPTKPPPLNRDNSVGGSRIIAPVDAGPREHATGTANYVDGVLLSYTVAADDHLEFVADRFTISYQYLMTINSVRRDTPELFVGDTINLSPYHMFSIGDQNGEVSDNKPPDPYPRDQRAADVP